MHRVIILLLISSRTLSLSSNSVSCPEISLPVITGKVTSEEVNEASGLVHSQKSRDILWTLNDSEGPPTIYALALDGTLVGSLTLDGASNIDWEAIEIATCPRRCIDNSNHCLYIGDIGDNLGTRSAIDIYIVPEPSKSELDQFFVSTTNWTKQSFRYPNHMKLDSEAMIIDPSTKDLFLISKSSQSKAKVFVGSLEQDDDEFLKDLGIQMPIYVVTDASLSITDEFLTRIVFRSRTDCIMYQGSHSTTVKDILKMDPDDYCELSLVNLKSQGEAIALNPNGQSYQILSEGVNQDLVQFQFINSNGSGQNCTIVPNTTTVSNGNNKSSTVRTKFASNIVFMIVFVLLS